VSRDRRCASRRADSIEPASGEQCLRWFNNEGSTMNNYKLTRLTLAALAGCTIAGTTFAAAHTMPAASRPAVVVDKDARMKAWNTDKDAMEKALGTGKDKAFYRQSLEKMGYYITAVNRDSADALEYEVVKGANSYEVQVDFKDGRSTKVDVTTNVWKAGTTRDALNNKNYKYVYPTAVTSNADSVRDRVRGKAWAGEKDAMEKSLGVGHDRTYYKPALERMGFRVTSVNESDPRNLEYEVVKGDTSYEVQVDFDANTKKSTRVGVSTNMWETDATERAKGDKK
jgi:hypothetical protein